MPLGKPPTWGHQQEDTIMGNVVTPFLRKRHGKQPSQADPRHRRDGYFDEQDHWHDAEKPAPAQAHHVSR